MRALFWTRMIFPVLLVLVSCEDPVEVVPEVVPDADPNATISLDELVEMNNYREGFIVDTRYFMGDRVTQIILNQTTYKSPLSLDLSGAGFYEISIYTKAPSGNNLNVIRIVVLDPERGQSEWGLAPWTPKGVEFGVLTNQVVKTIYPPVLPETSSYPVIVILDGELTQSRDNLRASADLNTFLIKRGVGSVWLKSGDKNSGKILIDNSSFPVNPGTMTEAPMVLNGELEENTLIHHGSNILITGDLTIPSGITLTIESGTFINIDPQVNIYNAGRLLINGTEDSVITLSCTNSESYWGGIIGKETGNLVRASHAIFARSGYHTGGEYDLGHGHRQALIQSENGSVIMDHTYMIDHIGQVMYTESAVVELDYCLVQRAKTGGQLNFSSVNIDHSVFTDFPDDSDEFLDKDNDGLYLIGCFAHIDNSVFMYAKDDGLDSGGGIENGEVRVSNTSFESIFHEGAALSGGSSEGKYQYFTSCEFIDCGQGLELGYGGRGHVVTVDSCRFVRNGIGIRWGDNYTYPHNGYLFVSNSESRENRDHDVWNMEREEWTGKPENMELTNVWVSKANPMYPELNIIE